MNTTSRIHALCDAFAKLNGALDPQSDAYRLRNPLMLKAFLPKHERDAKGRRVFHSFTSGYDNGVNDLKIKCSGKSFAPIGPDSSLADLVVLYGNPKPAARIIKNFLQIALNDPLIAESTPLSFFLEEIPQMENTEVTNAARS